MLLRILAALALLFSILFLPFWVSVILALLCVVYFKVFWEAVLLFLLSDVLFGAREAKFSGTVFISFIVSALAVVAAELLKKKLKFYPHM